MSVKETALLFGVSEMTVRRAFDTDGVPGIRFGRSYRVSRTFVDALVAEVEAGRQVDFADFAAAWPPAAVTTPPSPVESTTANRAADAAAERRAS